MIDAGFMVPHPPMIVPAIERGSEEQIRETITAYEQVAAEIAEIKPETIIITSPHSVMYADYFHISPGKGASGSFARFGVPEVRFDVAYDTELVEAIESLAGKQDFPAGTLGEVDPSLDHGTMVPLWFIDQVYRDYQLVRIGLSGLPLKAHYELGQIIRRAAGDTGRRVVFVASGDLSHKLQKYGPYGFAKEGPAYDEKVMDVCGRGAFRELLDFDERFCEKAAECGHRSFVIMAGAFDGVKIKAKKLSHQDVTGVGYGICTFYPDRGDGSGHPERCGDPYVQLAKASLESYIRSGKIIDIPEELPEEMLTRRAGAFVSIHEDGALRGCIGTIGPTTDCVAREIIHNAISASTRDPRFMPIAPEELDRLEINVDVLGEPEDIESTDQLDVRRYGVIVSSKGRRGLLLPDLDGVDTPEQQVDIARQKAGIGRFEKLHLQRFEVVRHV
ncbi:MAG: AmmeMemoRadiSam system protein A [Bacillota bacterium]|nr:AmmeMemoRadiSam system protein A [Bacillota bacterium]